MENGNGPDVDVLAKVRKEIENATDPVEKQMWVSIGEHLEKSGADIEKELLARVAAGERRREAQKEVARRERRQAMWFLPSIVGVLGMAAGIFVVGTKYHSPEFVLLAGLAMLLGCWRHRNDGGAGNAIAFMGLVVAAVGAVTLAFQFVRPA